MQNQPAGMGSHLPQQADIRATLVLPVMDDEVVPQP